MSHGEDELADGDARHRCRLARNRDPSASAPTANARADHAPAPAATWISSTPPTMSHSAARLARGQELALPLHHAFADADLPRLPPPAGRRCAAPSRRVNGRADAPRLRPGLTLPASRRERRLPRRAAAPWTGGPVETGAVSHRSRWPRTFDLFRRRRAGALRSRRRGRTATVPFDAASMAPLPHTARPTVCSADDRAHQSSASGSRPAHGGARRGLHRRLRHRRRQPGPGCRRGAKILPVSLVVKYLPYGYEP